MSHEDDEWELVESVYSAIYGEVLRQLSAGHAQPARVLLGVRAHARLLDELSAHGALGLKLHMPRGPLRVDVVDGIDQDAIVVGWDAQMVLDKAPGSCEAERDE